MDRDLDKTNLSGRNWLCCRILRTSAIAEADATMQVKIKDKSNSCCALKKLKSELIACVFTVSLCSIPKVFQRCRFFSNQ